MLSKKSKASGFIIMSAFGFAMMAAFVRLAGDLPFTQKTFFRNLVAVAVAAVVLCREKVGFKWEKGNLPLLIIQMCIRDRPIHATMLQLLPKA